MAPGFDSVEKLKEVENPGQLHQQMMAYCKKNKLEYQAQFSGNNSGVSCGTLFLHQYPFCFTVNISNNSSGGIALGEQYLANLAGREITIFDIPEGKKTFHQETIASEQWPMNDFWRRDRQDSVLPAQSITFSAMPLNEVSGI